MREDSAHRETAMEWSADIRAGMIDLFAGEDILRRLRKADVLQAAAYPVQGRCVPWVYDCGNPFEAGAWDLLQTRHAAGRTQ